VSESRQSNANHTTHPAIKQRHHSHGKRRSFPRGSGKSGPAGNNPIPFDIPFWSQAHCSFILPSSMNLISALLSSFFSGRRVEQVFCMPCWVPVRLCIPSPLVKKIIGRFFFTVLFVCHDALTGEGLQAADIFMLCI
jgi:hypothetical protein